ncbi:hypothetical protein [Thiohalophilus sp.]|uniref:hypothetical protein n=1 Tax=Thiohalophilus sp. TaxID=3028392 RepID=UPI002ACE27DB|nr:hypothetical protein [Thiohalophilus sp.]MDZ7802367.1 hypothetical protein [Thiohalophilus sp.]
MMMNFQDQRRLSINTAHAVGSQALAGRAKNANYSGEDLDPAALLAGELALHGFLPEVRHDLSSAIVNSVLVSTWMQWYDDELDERSFRYR